jgi:predicted nucleic acid-binding protein
MVDFIKKHSHQITILPHHKAAPDACRDPDDIPYLECADAVKVELDRIVKTLVETGIITQII